MNVETIELSELRVAAISHKGPYDQIAGAFARLGQVAGAAGLFGPSAMMLAIYYDNPRTTPAAELRSEAGITIPAEATVPQGLAEVRIPAGRYARTIHVGPYETLPEVWQRFMGEWLPQSGHHLRDGASLEIYRNNPHEVAKEKLITEICIAIA